MHFLNVFQKPNQCVLYILTIIYSFFFFSLNLRMCLMFTNYWLYGLRYLAALEYSILISSWIHSTLIWPQVMLGISSFSKKYSWKRVGFDGTVSYYFMSFSSSQPGSHKAEVLSERKRVSTMIIAVFKRLHF